jgi:hypothetical protein
MATIQDQPHNLINVSHDDAYVTTVREKCRRPILRQFGSKIASFLIESTVEISHHYLLLPISNGMIFEKNRTEYYSANYGDQRFATKVEAPGGTYPSPKGVTS